MWFHDNSTRLNVHYITLHYGASCNTIVNVNVNVNANVNTEDKGTDKNVNMAVKHQDEMECQDMRCDNITWDGRMDRRGWW